MKTNKEEIRKVLQIVKGKDFSEDHDLISGGCLDSFELLMLIQKLEDYFQICIPLEWISPEEFNSIDSIYEVIQKAAGQNA